MHRYNRDGRSLRRAVHILMNAKVALLAGLTLFAVSADAANYYPPKTNQTSIPVILADPITGAAGGAQGTPTQIAVTCGTSSTLALAAGTVTKFLRVTVPSSAAGDVFFNWAGATATASPPSDPVAKGTTTTWSPALGYLPTSAVNCIAAASTAVTITYN
jgi:hypothetical protein